MRYYINPEKKNLCTLKKKKRLDIFTPLHLFTQSSKNLEKYVNGGLYIK